MFKKLFKVFTAAWKAPYKGRSAALYLKRLIKGYEALKDPLVTASLGNLLPVCQSSGVGKSRLIDVISRCVFTINICFRPDNDSGFPSPDVEARDALIEILSSTKDEREKTKKLITFYVGIFSAASEMLNAMVIESHFSEVEDTNEKYTMLAGMWYDELNKDRKEFFSRALMWKSDYNPRNSNEYAVVVLSHAIGKLKNAIKNICGVSDPLILLVLDEVGTLIDIRVPGEDSEFGERQYSAMMLGLRKEIATGLMVSVLSSYAHYTKIIPKAYGTQTRIELAHVYHKSLTLPPFTEFEFDVCATPFEEGRGSLSEVCEPGFLAQYGRPLFKTIVDYGGHEVDIVKFARERLLGKDMPEPPEALKPFAILKKENLAFALLDIRIQFSSETSRLTSVDRERAQIASYFSTIICIPNHGFYIHHGHASEPLLAEAAAQLLRLDMGAATVFAQIDGTLGDVFKARGERGEFFARLLLTMAHDNAITGGIRGDKKTFHFSKPIKLIEFMRVLLSDLKFNEVMMSKPEENIMQGETFEVAFEDAYVNFTHFCKCKGRSESGKTSKTNPARLEYIWQGLIRSAAFICRENQECIDMIIPVAFSQNGKGPERAYLSAKNSSAILIQVKNRKNPRPVNYTKFGFFPEENAEANPETFDKKRAYIYLVMEFDGSEGGPPSQKQIVSGQDEPRPPVTRAVARAKDDPPRSRYKVNITGIRGVYRSIPEDTEDSLNSILRKDSPDKEYPYLEDSDSMQIIKSIPLLVGEGQLVPLKGVA